MDRCIYIYMYICNYLSTYTGSGVSASGHRGSGVKENQMEKNAEN